MSKLFITGKTGVGKSSLLAEAKTSGVSVLVVDCLAPGGATFNEPNPAAIDVVAVDHIASLSGEATAVVRTAAEWAYRNKKPLWLIEMDKRFIEKASGMVIGPGDVELQLTMNDEPLSSEVLEEHGRSKLLGAFESVKHWQRRHLEGVRRAYDAGAR